MSEKTPALATASETGHFRNLRDFMRWGASCFMQAGLEYGHGMASALDEAVYLVLRTLHLPVDTPEVYWDGRLTETEKQQITEIIRQRIETRKPAAYLTSEGWFAGLPFYVDERVLVPRSPIAELVQQQFSPWVDADETHAILDLCTGSGCIGIACAYAFPHARVDLADISADALDVAHINIERHGLQQQVTAIQSDLFIALQGKQYDIIVSNPPYVDAEDLQGMAAEFHHEPVIGLSSGEDGLELMRQILLQAADYLTPNGILVAEAGNSMYALQEEFPDAPFYWFEFEHGGHGVFMLTHDQLREYFQAGC